MGASMLKQAIMRGPLYNNMMKKKSSSGQKSFVFALNLTALIDAFSILVIFLLSNFNSDAQNININSNMVLPKVTQAELMTMGTVIRIEGNKYLIDDKNVSLNDIVERLIATKKSNEKQVEGVQSSLIIQADRNVGFDILSPIIKAGGQAGFNKYKFAVLPRGSEG
ncbi:MAG: biopolymer transporter ExbD [Bdellovibrionales bacterium]|nr:biopolymer transporter ExbD [Bdellovibrionales bacterium]